MNRMQEESVCVGTMTGCCCFYKPCDGPFKDDNINWWFVGTVFPPCMWPIWCAAGTLFFAGAAVALPATLCCCCCCCNNEQLQDRAKESAWNCCKSTCCCFITKKAYYQ